jgi:hypothetical protein
MPDGGVFGRALVRVYGKSSTACPSFALAQGRKRLEPRNAEDLSRYLAAAIEAGVFHTSTKASLTKSSATFSLLPLL